MKTFLMIFLGMVLILSGSGNAWRQYRLEHSILDLPASASQEAQLPPPRTFEVPSPTLTPFQPLDEPVANLLPLIAATQVPVLSPTVPNRSPTPAHAPVSLIPPERIFIPAINLDAPIIPIHTRTLYYQNRVLQQWLTPDVFAAGWHDTSAVPGQTGNIVLNGHHNAFGQVFHDLYRLQSGDEVFLWAGTQVYHYQVAETLFLSERYRTLEERLVNATWIMPSPDTRLTLVTCWPPDGNSQRVVVVAFPVP
jgi:LPXTG-site transpeptidase (sortase) family protein